MGVNLRACLYFFSKMGDTPPLTQCYWGRDPKLKFFRRSRLCLSSLLPGVADNVQNTNNTKCCCPHFSSRVSFSFNTMMRSFLLAALLFSGASAFAPAKLSTRTSGVISLASSVDDKTEVREYFNTEGFNRWNKIYSESDEVNTVQLDIRTGHDQTIQKILNWISDDGDIKGKSVCDCGCGVGSLAIPLAQMGE